ncbi:MAG: hypothetical protein WBO04_12985 [Steroidobacteraceae bacterium]
MGEVHLAARGFLGAGVHDVGLAQHLELQRRALERGLRGVHAALQQRTKIPRAFPAHGLDLAREIGEHGQDRAFARVRQAFARVGGPAVHPVGEIVGAQVAQVPEPVAHAEEELRQDCARVAAGSVECGVGHARERLAGMPVRPALQRAEHRVHGEREVGPGVAVGHREHVDLVQVLLAGEQAHDARLEGAIEPQPVEAVAQHCGGGHQGRLPLTRAATGSDCRAGSAPRRRA